MKIEGRTHGDNYLSSLLSFMSLALLTLSRAPHAESATLLPSAAYVAKRNAKAETVHGALPAWARRANSSSQHRGVSARSSPIRDADFTAGKPGTPDRARCVLAPHDVISARAVTRAVTTRALTSALILLNNSIPSHSLRVLPTQYIPSPRSPSAPPNEARLR